MSLFVAYEILGVFLHTLTSDDKYFSNKWKNFPQPIQIQLSKKAKAIVGFFCSFECYINVVTF